MTDSHIQFKMVKVILHNFMAIPLIDMLRKEIYLCWNSSGFCNLKPKATLPANYFDCALLGVMHVSDV